MRLLSAAAAALLVACTSLTGLSEADGGALDAGEADGPAPDGGSATDASASDSGAAEIGPDAPQGDVDSSPAAPIALAQPPISSPLESSATTVAAQITAHAGTVLVAAVYWCCGSPAPATMSVGDTLGNTWQVATAPENNYESASTGGSCKADAQIFYATNARAGSGTVTVTRTGTAMFGFFLIEYSGVAAVNTVDGFSGQSTPPGGTNEISTIPFVTSGANDVIVALWVDTTGSGQITPGAGFVTRGANTQVFAMVQDDLPAGVGAGSHTPNAFLPNNSTDNCWAGAAAAFRGP
jgi:hypothetical protein